MAEALTRLVREVERVVTAPYVPSLQDLYNLIQEPSASVILASWALQKPCQVGLLADALVDGLSRSRVALPLLVAFASTTAFRDALLCRHPVILDTFLEKADDANESEYHPACVALLSSLLPPGTILPARLAGFITKLVSIMAARPCAETVAPLHTLVSSLGSSSGILDEVPTEVISNLQLEFTKTLRNLDDHMGNLLCLAAFARLASPRNANTRNQHGAEPPSWLLNIQHFFGPKRGLKTLDLVVLRVILACSANCSKLTPSLAAESIRLAICIADAVDPAQREAWIAGNSSKVAKLCEKVSRDGLGREVQVVGVAFLLSLLPVAALPYQIRDLGLRILVSKDSQVALRAMPPHVVSRLTASLASCDESIVYELLRFTVDALKDDSPSPGSLCSLHVAELLLSSFQSAESKLIISCLLNSASTKETIASLLGWFPTIQNQGHCQGSEVCYCAYSALKNRILLDLFDIYLDSALPQHGDNADILVMKSFVDRVAPSLGQKNCLFFMSDTQSFHQSLFVRDRRDFPSASLPARDWRSGVAETFAQNARTSHDTMMKLLGDVCFDLERRCYDVEGPLRSVEGERDRHALEAEQLRHQKEELERQLGQSSTTISALQQDLTRLEEHTQGACTRAEELSAFLDTTRQELQDLRRLSEERLHLEREAARTRELDLIATSTAKDDQLEELQDELRRLQSENEQMRQNLDLASKDKATSSEITASLRKELEEAKGHLESAKAMCSEKENEVKRLLTDKEDMRMEMGTMKTKIEEQILDIDRHYSALQELEGRLQHVLRDQEAEATQAAKEIEEKTEENARLRTALQRNERDYRQKLHLMEERIQDVEKSNDSLRNERATKAKEFSEAQQHISRLMGVMGFIAKPAEPSASPMYQRTRSVQSASRRHPTTFDDDEASQLAESFDTLNSNLQGPIPKRPRGNRHSGDLSEKPHPETPGPAAPNSNIPPPIASRERITRHPLAETDFNSPNKPSLTDPPGDSQKDAASPEKPGHHLQNLDLEMDLEFSKDFIFTSTAFSGSNEQLAPL